MGWLIIFVESKLITEDYDDAMEGAQVDELNQKDFIFEEIDAVNGMYRVQLF